MDDYKSVAIEAAKAAGDILLELSKTTIEYRMKNSHDIQADADLQSEKMIIGKIKAAFPTHSILSEEAGEETNSSGYLWVIDPLDGTINYARGIEEFCVSIALCLDDQTILGVIYQPTLDLLFVAEKGKGAYLNDEKLEVFGENELINCLVATDNSAHLEARHYNLDTLLKISNDVRGVRIFGSCALHVVRIVQGQLDFYFKSHYNHWDFAASTLILEEAGGIATDTDGQPLTRHSKSALAATKVIHARALALIKSKQPKSK